MELKMRSQRFPRSAGEIATTGNPNKIGRVIKIDLPVLTKAEVTRKLLAAKEGKEGTPVSDTPSTEVYGWLFEAGASGDLHKASDAFKRAAAIIDKLAGAEPT